MAIFSRRIPDSELAQLKAEQQVQPGETERPYQIEARRAQANHELGKRLKSQARRNTLGNVLDKLVEADHPKREVSPKAVMDKLDDADDIVSWLERYRDHVDASEPGKTFKSKDRYLKELNAEIIVQGMGSNDLPMPNKIAHSLGDFIDFATPNPDEIIELGQMAVTADVEPADNSVDS